jgi:hypothetical protein
MKDNLWKLYPEHKPIKDGYYMTIHQVGDKEYFKGIWWNTKSQKWVKWRTNLEYELTVLEFIPDTCAPYYTECLKIARSLETRVEI